MSFFLTIVISFFMNNGHLLDNRLTFVNHRSIEGESAKGYPLLANHNLLVLIMHIKAKEMTGSVSKNIEKNWK